jgi:multiple sugar transport system substrate-binding protein
VALAGRARNIIRYIVFGCLVIPAIALLAFGPREHDTTPDGRVVIEYWEKWTGYEEAEMRHVVDQFNETEGKKDGIFVRFMSTSSVNQKTLVATAAGTPPDVAGLWDYDVPQYAAMDALEPLDTMAAAHGITAASYQKVYWDECHYDGRLYALFSTPNVVALHYNKPMFAAAAGKIRAAGLDPDRAPRTIDELDRYAAALDVKDANGRYDVMGYLPGEPGWYLNYTCFWFGGSWWDDKNRRFTFTDPAVIKSYQWVQSYYKRMGPTAAADFQSGVGNFDSPQNAFMAHTVAMEQQGVFFANFIHHQQPAMDGQWGLAPFPSAVPGLNDVCYCNGDVLVIPRTAKHKKEAFEFVAYVNRQDVMEELCSVHCKTSPLSHVSEKFLANHANPYAREFQRLAASPNAHGTPPVPIIPEVMEEMKNFSEKLSLLKTTPEAGLAEVQERLQKKLDQFNAIQAKRRAESD